MGKSKGGLPYLRSSFKFDFSSTERVPEDDTTSFYCRLADVLRTTLPSPLPLPEQVGPRGHEIKVGGLSIGLQPAFDLLNDGICQYVLFDSSLARPSAISTAIGISVINCSGCKAFCLPGLKEALANLNIISDALATSSDEKEVSALLSSMNFKQVTLTSSKKEQKKLSSATVYRSIGKANKSKK